MAPLLDPFKFLIGKYNINDHSLFNLPKLTTNGDIGTVHPKLLDCNNSAYVDGFFSFLSSTLIHKYDFVNGVDYYGSFLGIKKDFKLNIIDDLDYLCKSEFFNKNKNINFQVDDYSFLYNDEDKPKQLVPIKIDHNISNKSNLSIKSIDDGLFEDLFTENHLTLDDLKDNSIELVDLMASETFSIAEAKTTTIKSGSTCSSRTSHTSDNSGPDESCNNCDETSNNAESNDNDAGSENAVIMSESGSESGSDEFCEEERIEATIPSFPVQVICMENCDTTFDDLIINNELTQEEWFSALMQVIMILITYQKAFSFTHNDLHTNV